MKKAKTMIKINSGLKQYLMVVLAFGVLGGGYFVYKSHAQTPPTVVKTYTASASQLKRTGADYMTTLNGSPVLVAVKNHRTSNGPTYNTAHFPDPANRIVGSWQGHTGYKSRVCVKARNISSSTTGQLELYNYANTGKGPYLLNSPVAGFFSSFCTPYETINYNHGGVEGPELRANFTNEWIKSMSIEIAK